MMKRALANLTLALLTVPALAQSAAPSQPTFEVATVKLSPPNAVFTSFSEPGSFTYTATNASLVGLIDKAFNVNDTQIVGLPQWSDTTHYDIDAKPPGDKPFTDAQLQQALQQLLKDRLHLSIHRETRQVKGYNLVVAKAPPNLQPSKGGPIGRFFINADGFDAPNITLQQFSQRLLYTPVGVPVVDATGIGGSFTIKLKCATDADSDSPLPSIFTALEEQLGLKLVPAKVPAETIVIDHVDRAPTPN
jgi:uncharacterized protein (TIGR03435 family)